LIIAALSGILLVVAAGFLFRAARAPAVEVQANSLAVLAFQNLKDPADPERLGQILQELVITDLSRLSSLKVFSSQRLYDVFKQVAGNDQKTVSREIATQFAARAGASTMLTGTLSQLGTKWIMTGQLVDVAKGTVLKSARIDGTDLYSMVNQLAGQIRGDFNAPVADTATAELPVGAKTTTSMEAYRLYLTGVDLLNGAKYKPAAEQFEKAIAIDPAFSQAYYKLAIARWWNGDDPEPREPQPPGVDSRRRGAGYRSWGRHGTEGSEDPRELRGALGDLPVHSRRRAHPRARRSQERIERGSREAPRGRGPTAPRPRIDPRGPAAGARKRQVNLLHTGRP